MCSSESSWKTSKNWVSTAGIGTPTTKMMLTLRRSRICAVALPAPTVLIVSPRRRPVEAPLTS